MRLRLHTGENQLLEIPTNFGLKPLMVLAGYDQWCSGAVDIEKLAWVTLMKNLITIIF